MRIESFSIEIKEISRVDNILREEKRESIMIISKSKISLANFKIEDSTKIKRIFNKI